MPVTETVLVTKLDSVSGAQSIPIPAGPAGDHILIFAESEGNSSGANSFSTPAGYAAIYNLNPHANHATAAFHKVAGASEPNPSTTITAAGTVDAFFFAVRISGQDLATPVDADSGSTTGTGITNGPATKTMTIDFVAAAIYAMWSIGAGTTSGTNADRTPQAPAGFTQIAEAAAVASSFFTQGRLFRRDVDAPAGAFGAVTPVAPVDAISGNRQSGVVAINVAPSPGGGGTMGMGSPTLPRMGERIQRGEPAEGYKVYVPKGMRLKNPVERIEDPWGTIRRIKPEDEEEEEKEKE